MTVDIVTIFPAMIEQPLAAGIIGRAIERGTLDVKVRDLRDFTTDRHRVVDDVPYGGGPGMVLKPDPIFRALDAVAAERGTPLTVIMTSPQGRRFTQAEAQRLSGLEHIVLLCGRYEGFDDRVRERVTEELSIGDYVLTGGELPALVILDAVARFVLGRGRRRAIGRRGFVQPRAAGFPAVHAAAGDRRAAGPRRAAVGQSRGDSPLAETGSVEPDARTAAGSPRRRKFGRRRTTDAAGA